MLFTSKHISKRQKVKALHLQVNIIQKDKIYIFNYLYFKRIKGRGILFTSKHNSKR